MPSEALLSLHDVPARMPGEGWALVHGGERWVWARLRRRSEQWAARLIDADVRPHDFVAFALPNGPELMALTFGVYRAGATPAPLSPRMVDRELPEIVDLLRPAAFVGHQKAMATRSLAAPEDSLQVSYPDPPVAASWKACMSGGSTGRLKVIVDGRPAAFVAGAEFIGIPERGRVFVPGPLHHNATFSAAVLALWRGSTLVTMLRFDPEQALALIAAERTEWALMVPTMMHRVLQLPDSVFARYDLSSWRTVVHTASSMAPATKRAWIDRFGPEHVREVYGATEGLFGTWIGGGEWLDHPGSVERTAPGFHLSIRDEDGIEVEPGREGKIFAIPPNSPGSSYSYIGAQRRLIADGWESVGDFGRLDSSGYLYLSDRRADLIISAGVNIWSAEFEAAILEHPGIRSCAVFGLADGDVGMRVHAVVETDDETLDLDTLRGVRRPGLWAAKMPRSITRTVDSVRDDAGKVRKSAWRTVLEGNEHAR